MEMDGLRDYNLSVHLKMYEHTRPDTLFTPLVSVRRSLLEATGGPETCDGGRAPGRTFPR